MPSCGRIGSSAYRLQRSLNGSQSGPKARADFDPCNKLKVRFLWSYLPGGEDGGGGGAAEGPPFGPPEGPPDGPSKAVTCKTSSPSQSGGSCQSNHIDSNAVVIRKKHIMWAEDGQVDLTASVEVVVSPMTAPGVAEKLNCTPVGMAPSLPLLVRKLKAVT